MGRKTIAMNVKDEENIEILLKNGWELIPYDDKIDYSELEFLTKKEVELILHNDKHNN